jgi:hypothetical protein
MTAGVKVDRPSGGALDRDQGVRGRLDLRRTVEPRKVPVLREHTGEFDTGRLAGVFWVSCRWYS